MIFSFPGMCTTDMYTHLFIKNSQLFVATLLHNMDLTPRCLFMHDVSVLSVITLRCFIPTFEKITSFIAVSSNTFTCNLVSPFVHLPFIVWCLTCALQPLTLQNLSHCTTFC